MKGFLSDLGFCGLGLQACSGFWVLGEEEKPVPLARRGLWFGLI